MKKTLSLKPYTVLELARLYGISDRTMKKWIRPFETEVGTKIGHFYTVAQVRVILEHLGIPGEVEID